MNKVICLICVVALILLGVVGQGCSHHVKPIPLAPQFGAATSPPRTPKEIASDPLSGADQPGPLYDNARVQFPEAEADQRPSGPGARPLSRTVQENVTAPGQRGDERLNDSTAATMPASVTD